MRLTKKQKPTNNLEMKNLGIDNNQGKINVSDVELDLPAPPIQ